MRNLVSCLALAFLCCQAQDRSPGPDTLRGMRRHRATPKTGMNGVVVGIEGTVKRGRADEPAGAVAVFDSLLDYDTLEIGEQSSVSFYNLKTSLVITIKTPGRVQLYDDTVKVLGKNETFYTLDEKDLPFERRKMENGLLVVADIAPLERKGADAYLVSPLGRVGSEELVLEARPLVSGKVLVDVEIVSLDGDYKHSFTVETGVRTPIKPLPPEGFYSIKITKILADGNPSNILPDAESFMVVPAKEAAERRERVAALRKKAKAGGDVTRLVRDYMEAAKAAAPFGEKRWDGNIPLALDVVDELKAELELRAGGETTEIYFILKEFWGAYGMPLELSVGKILATIRKQLDDLLGTIRDGRWNSARHRIERLRPDLLRSGKIQNLDSQQQEMFRRYASILTRYEGIILAGEARFDEAHAKYEEALKGLEGEGWAGVERANTMMDWGVSGLRELHRLVNAAIYGLARSNDPLRESEPAARAWRLAEAKLSEARQIYESLQGSGSKEFAQAVAEGLAECRMNQGLLCERVAALCSLYRSVGGYEQKLKEADARAREHFAAVERMIPTLQGSAWISDLTVTTKNGLGMAALRENDLKAAAERFAEARALFPSAQERLPLQIAVRANLARVLAKTDPAQALQELAGAIESVEQMKFEVELGMMGETRANFLADRSAIYDLAIRLSFERREWAQAFQFIERSKGRAMMDLWLKREKERQRIGTPPEYTAKLETVQQYLRERKTALLEYYVGSDFVLVCLVTGDSVHIEQLRGPADVGPVSGDFMELLRSFDNIYQGWRRGANDRAAREVTASLDDNLAKTQAALAKLAELVLGPMAERLDAAEPLCVVPHGPLYSLPIHALPLKNGDPLIARRPVFYSMSAAALCLQIERNKKTAPTPADQWNALIAAKHSFSEYGKDPQGQPTLPPLNTISEATRVAALFDQKTVLTDYEDDQGDKPSAAPPTKAAVKQALRQRRDFVLFSTHACFGTARDTFADTDDPLDSFVVLNKGGGEDGLLSLEEIIDLNLAGSVVYLSACQTGQAGGLVGGSSTYDEFVSLAAGFSLAGSSAVIASMRPVWDNSSKKISIEFARLLREGPPRAEALRAALLKIREYKGEFWNHPAHWAAFILIGDGT